MPRAGLTPALVVSVASVVADESRFDQLTLAAVAQRLGVALPSLYKHVGGLDDLRRRMSVQALDELGDALSRATVGRSRGDALRGLAGAYWEYAHAHPGRYAATLRSPAADDADAVAATAHVLEVVYAVLAGYGITDEDAGDATRMLRAVLHGYAVLESAGGFGTPRDVRRSLDRVIDALDAMFTDWSRPARRSG